MKSWSRLELFSISMWRVVSCTTILGYFLVLHLRFNLKIGSYEIIYWLGKYYFLLVFLCQKTWEVAFWTFDQNINSQTLRGVIFKIQPLRNPSIFNNMICVPISKVLLKGMSNHPHFKIFWTSSKIWKIRIFFQNSKFHVRKNCCWCHQWAIYQ